MEVPFNGTTSVPNFMKLYQAFEKLLVGGTHRRTDRQTGDLISLLSFLESRLKIITEQLCLINPMEERPRGVSSPWDIQEMAHPLWNQ
jgi:hypothetical protein